MNCLILPSNSPLALPPDSQKLEHVKKVLKTEDGGEIFAGRANGPLMICRVRFRADGGANLEPMREIPLQPPLPVNLAVAFARPQIAQRLLFEAACFGVQRLIFYAATKGEADYAKSGLYARGEYEDWLVKGAEQACATHIPKFFAAKCAEEAAEIASDSAELKIAPDLYEATQTIATALNRRTGKKQTTAIMLGSERGFADADRHALRARGYILVSMGGRVLRTDTAAISALALCSNLPIKND